ncbi:sodium:solute symporter family protein [Arthrobacter sp. VKM Ac-2550]|uniref:sodium:solute symporter family protein n=1 Tax=Crystallibacter permensis TaxID=1938888 RepID=UPI002226EB26|nr:sodium:solute symporter family protein [Arthrobacter sp. VKM Ac-2550]MCW2135418.1 solute:Na+ symporter, SSS family [Arthrobacter sp. VKM Ac-2550]
MTSAGAWTLGLALFYTVLLAFAGRAANRRADRGEGFFVGGRTFGPWTVAFCITGLFSGSSYIAIMELSYRTGISAVWYGVAETVQILLIALILVKPLRNRLLVTVTGLIGERFGRKAQAIAGSITAFTFPMWSVATAIAFASALQALTGMSIHVAIIFTAVLLLAFLSAGGMRAVAFTQTANCMVFIAMLIIGLIAFFINPGFEGLRVLASERPEMLDLSSAGLTLIVAWFGTFIVNVILAQAAFQMAMSCRTPEAGRKGMLYAAGLGVPFIIIGALLGTAAAIVVPAQDLALVAIPTYIADVLPAPLAGVFFLGVWACALSWAGPCQFSGATSLGRDVGKALRPQATENDLVRYTRWSLLILTVLMIVFAILRTEQSAWWNVLAWTLRNGATLAPVLAALFWPLATRRSAYAAMIAGFATGLSWYHFGHWSHTDFLFGIHPVWMGMTANIAVMVAVTLSTVRWQLTANSRSRNWGRMTAWTAAAFAALSATFWGWLHPQGLSGLAAFLVVAAAAAATFLLTTQVTGTGGAPAMAKAHDEDVPAAS